MDTLTTAPRGHGGLIFPLDMFRPTVLAAVIGELLLGKVRNIIDATLEIVRHPGSPLALARIHGGVVGDDPFEFWRTNPDIALAASQTIPRQCFVYYARAGENRREGFIVAQRGQALAADDSERDPSGNHWPVARLTEQLRISLSELSNGFPGGPRIELSLMEPRGNDQNLLMTLIGQAPGGPENDEELEDEAPPPPPPARGGGGLTQGFTAPSSNSAAPTHAHAHAPPSQGATSPSGANTRAPNKPAPLSAADDAKRRANEKAAEQLQLQARSQSAAKELRYSLDSHGALVFLPVELSDTDVLRHYHISAVESSLPDGLPRSLQQQLHGRSVDFAVKVEFFSEVFLDNHPLNRPKFDERARELLLNGVKVKALEVLAPRLGFGTLLRLGSCNAFVSRRVDAQLQAASELLLAFLRH